MWLAYIPRSYEGGHGSSLQGNAKVEDNALPHRSESGSSNLMSMGLSQVGPAMMSLNFNVL